MDITKALKIALVMTGMATLAQAAVQVGPNPWIPTDEKAATGDYTNGITFRNLPDSGQILLYTTAGELVRTLDYTTSETKWDGKNEDGSYVASGVYLWVVKTTDDARTGKLLVIR